MSGQGSSPDENRSVHPASTISNIHCQALSVRCSGRPTLPMALLRAALLLWLVSLVQPQHITVRQGHRRIAHSGNGLLRGLNSTFPSDALVAPLKPTMERIWTVDKDPAVVPRLRRLGVSQIQYVLSGGGSKCGVGHVECFKAEIALHDRLGFLKVPGWGYDVENEPKMRTDEQFEAFLVRWDVAVATIRRAAPSAAVVGPSLHGAGVPDYGHLHRFLLHCQRKGTLPDILAWHELADGVRIPEYVQNVTRFLEEHGMRSIVKSISLNEVVSPQEQYNAAAHMSVLHGLEKAGVQGWWGGWGGLEGY